MNKELVMRLYTESANLCDTSEAWEWELSFARRIVLECISVIRNNNYNMEFESEHLEEAISNHFSL